MESGSCSLRNILNEGRIYTEPQIKGFLEEMCIALHECQIKRIAHRDIKPENLILNEFNSKYIICDFGEAIQVSETSNEIYESCVGTIPYLSKEMYDQVNI